MELTLNEVERGIIARHNSSVRGRALLEMLIVDAIWKAAETAGYTLRLMGEDAEEDVSTADKFKLAVFNLDEVGVRVCGIGWIFLVFGNGGYDLISDYSTSLDAFLAPVNALAESLGT